MVGMQMRTERGIEQIGPKGIFAAAVRFRCASYDAGAEIDEVRMAVDNDGGSRAARPRAGVRRSRTEQNKFRFHVYHAFRLERKLYFHELAVQVHWETP